jgi:hypothetical protein
MSSISRLFGRVAAALFYTTLLAANTAFADEHNPAQVLARECTSSAGTIELPCITSGVPGNFRSMASITSKCNP